MKLAWKVKSRKIQLLTSVQKSTWAHAELKAHAQVLFSAGALLDEGASGLAGGTLSVVLLMT